MLPGKPMIWIYTSDIGAHQYSILFRSVKSSLKDICLCLNMNKLYPFTYLESVYWLQIIFPGHIVFLFLQKWTLYSVETDLSMNCILPVNSILPWCSQPIVCWLHQAWQCMGWSVLQTQETQHSREKKPVGEKPSCQCTTRRYSWKGIAEVCTWIYFNRILHVFRLQIRGKYESVNFRKNLFILIKVKI